MLEPRDQVRAAGKVDTFREWIGTLWPILAFLIGWTIAGITWAVRIDGQITAINDRNEWQMKSLNKLEDARERLLLIDERLRGMQENSRKIDDLQQQINQTKREEYQRWRERDYRDRERDQGGRQQ